MPTLLHIDSSPMGETSVSRHLTNAYVHQWKQTHPGSRVITRDVTTTSIPPVSAAWVGAAYTPAEYHQDSQKAELALSDTLVDELFTADEYVLGVPMHNFSIPSTLKLWIDQVARVNKTFSYATGRPEGLLKGKKATFLIASGGVYDAGTAMASFNFVEPYLRSVFGFLGVTDTHFHTAGGAAALNAGGDRETFLKPHLAAITNLQAA